MGERKSPSLNSDCERREPWDLREQSIGLSYSGPFRPQGRTRKPSVPCRVQKGVTISWFDDQLRYGSRPGQQSKG